MNSSTFLLRYASVTTALFDHIEHDMLALACAFIDDDEPAGSVSHDTLWPQGLKPLYVPVT
jgi:hypothetical protein